MPCRPSAFPRRRPTVRPASGFTLVELLIVGTLLLLVVLLGVPTIQNLILRSRLEGVANETSILLHASRLEAIKAAGPAVVRVVPAAETIEAFVDEDGDGAFTDGEKLLRRYALPQRVAFGGPEADPDAVVGFTTVGSDQVVLFRSDGSVDAVGALRIGDGAGNFLEVRVEPRATARVQVRKWDGGAWRVQGEGGVRWTWS